jgi:hypothetical protein
VGAKLALEVVFENSLLWRLARYYRRKERVELLEEIAVFEDLNDFERLHCFEGLTLLIELGE